MTSTIYQSVIAEIAAHNELVKADSTKAYSITQLTAFIERLSGAVPDGAKISVFYGGHLLVDANGTALPDSIHSSDIVSLLPEASNGQIASLSETEAYQITRNDEFKQAFKDALKQMGITRNSPEGKAIWAGGVDPASGQPLGIFDIVSKVFARDAAGNVMVVSTFPENSRTGIFALHELPELLKNSKVTHINGIDISYLRTMAQAPDGMTLVLDRIKAQSALDLAYIKVGRIDATDRVKITSIDTTTLLSSKYGLTDIHNPVATESMALQLDKIKTSLGSIYLEDIHNLSPVITEQINRINEGSSGGSLANKGVIWVGLVIGLIVASQSAQAAEAAGKHEEAAVIMRDWAGELVGALIGGAIFATGVAGAIPAGAGAVAAGVVILAGSMVGGVFGADIGKWIFENTGEIGLTLGRLMANANSNVYDMFTSYYNAALTDPVYRQKFLEIGGYADPLDPAYYTSKSIYDPLTEKGAYSTLYVKEKGLAEWYKYLAEHQTDTSTTKVNVDSNGNIWVGALPTESDGSWIYQFAGDNKKITYAPYRSREHFILFGSDTGPDLLEGRAFEDHLYGGGGSDILKGGGGNDYLEGGDWDDQLYGDEGNDRLLGMTGEDHLYGGTGDDILLGGSGDDKLFGGDGNDYLHGGSGDDQLFGEAGNDILIGGTGAITLSDGGDGNDLIYADKQGGYNDILVGGSGNDIIYGYNGNNLLAGGDGSDLLYGGDNIDNIVGDSGNDFIYGGNGTDVLNGNTGNDFLIGGDDSDGLEGGEGADRLQGEEGVDRYLFRGDFGTDTIIDTDGQGQILFDDYILAVGEYNQNGHFWNSSNGQYEIRKVGASEGRTTIIINKKDDKKNTIFIENSSFLTSGIAA